MIKIDSKNGVEGMYINAQDKKMLVYDKYVKWFIHCKTVDWEL